MQAIIDKANELKDLCEFHGLGDPFTGNRMREMLMSFILKQKIGESYSGPDGYDERGKCEYKSTIGPKIKATYNGISRKPSWEEQVVYLNEKLGNINHYVARFDKVNIVELYKLDGDAVVNIILPRIKKQYFDIHTHRADPRLVTILSTGAIYSIGERIGTIS